MCVLERYCNTAHECYASLREVVYTRILYASFVPNFTVGIVAVHGVEQVVYLETEAQSLNIFADNRVVDANAVYAVWFQHPVATRGIVGVLFADEFYIVVHVEVAENVVVDVSCRNYFWRKCSVRFSCVIFFYA